MKQRISLMFVLALVSAQISTASGYKSHVSEVCELVSTVCRLAGFDEYNNNAALNYTTAVDSVFNPYKEHEVVTFLKKTRKTHKLAYDALMGYVCYIEIEGNKIRVKDFTSFDHLTESDSRWTVDVAEQFTELLNDFYLKSEFNEFFKGHRTDYSKAEEWLDTYIIPDVNYDWFTNFFGVDKTKNLSVIPSMLNSGNYGTRVENTQSEEYFPYVIIGPIRTDSDGNPTYYKNGGIILHEFTHSFVNPSIYQFEDTLSVLSKPYFEYARETLKDMAYHSPTTQIIETLVRVCNVIYKHDNGANPEQINSEIIGLTAYGFPLAGKVYDALVEDYSLNREQYPTFADYIPRLVEIISQINPDTLINNIDSSMGEMTLFGLEDGAVNVPSGEVTVRLHFSKPHKYGFGESAGRSGELIDPEIVKGPKHDENGDLLITFMLEPNMKYDFSFDGSLFRSEDMWPMKNTIYLTFETAPEN